MKTLAILSLAAALPVCTCAAGLSEPHIVVFGTANTEVTPDHLKWRLTLRTAGTTIAVVAEQHERRTESVLAFLREAGAAATEVQTSQMSLDVRRVFRSRAWAEDGYEATTAITFTTKDLSRYRDLWHGLSQLEGVGISASRWETSQRIELQNRTRTEALKAARSKAEQMAAALGATVGPPLAIEELLLPEHDLATNRAALNFTAGETTAAADAAAGVSPGVLAVRVRVQVTFALKSS